MATKKLTRTDSDHALKLAQLKKLQLENEKLRLELEGFKTSKPWYALWVQFVPLISVLVAVSGFLWGIYVYQAQQTRNLELQKQQSEQEVETAQRELMKPWLENQRDIYLQALTAAATIANTDDPQKREQATEEFWKLFNGKMILVETDNVRKAMVNFSICINLNRGCDKSEKTRSLRELATAMANSMAATAQMTYEEFSANQFKYEPATVTDH
jgi:hypothetical protein